SSLGTDELPLRSAGSIHRVLDLCLADGDRDADGVAKCLENDEVAQCLRYPDAGGKRPRVWPLLRFVGSLDERLDDRRATLGLSGHEARLFRVEPADCSELVECLPHADEADSAAGWVHDHVRHAPSELLCELEPH